MENATSFAEKAGRQLYLAEYYKRNKKGKFAEYNRRRQEARRAEALLNPNARKREFMKNEWGITLEQYNEMLNAQGGVCAICIRGEIALTRHGKIKSLSIDHDHESGLIRGLLCQACNRLLGDARDDRAVLSAAISYLDAAESVVS